MRISKYELITEIAMLCDELEAHKRHAEDLQRDIETCSDCGGFSPVDLMCLKAGRKAIFEECTNTYWNHVEAERGEDGQIKVMSFENYRDKIYSRCPDSMSKREFFEYFDGEFRDKYEEEKAQAIAKLEEAEDE